MLWYVLRIFACNIQYNLKISEKVLVGPYSADQDLLNRLERFASDLLACQDGAISVWATAEYFRVLHKAARVEG